MTITQKQSFSVCHKHAARASFAMLNTNRNCSPATCWGLRFPKPSYGFITTRFHSLCRAKGEKISYINNSDPLRNHSLQIAVIVIVERLNYNLLLCPKFKEGHSPKRAAIALLTFFNLIVILSIDTHIDVMFCLCILVNQQTNSLHMP